MTIFVIVTRVLPIIFLTLFVLDPQEPVKYWLCFFTTLLLLINEANQLRVLAVRDYLADILNWVDLFGNISGLIWLSQYKELCMDESDKEVDSDDTKEECKMLYTDLR